MADVLERRKFILKVSCGLLSPTRERACTGLGGPVCGYSRRRCAAG
jgi:hypothetical protein